MHDKRLPYQTVFPEKRLRPGGAESLRTMMPPRLPSAQGGWHFPAMCRGKFAAGMTGRGD